MPEIPVGELVWLATLIVAGGIVTGILAGLFGIGGGGIIVPVLYEVFRALDVPDSVRMQLCIGTSIAIIVPTAIRSYRTHKARGAGSSEIVRVWALPSVIGVAVGAGVAAVGPGWVFKLSFAVLGLIIAAKLFVGHEKWRLGAELPQGPLMKFYGFFVGLAASLMGVSGGAITNLVLSLYGTPIHQAVATAAGVGVPITIAGAIGYMLAGLPHMAQLPPLSLGFVSLIGLVLMAPVSSFMASYGALLAHRLPRRTLEIAFGCFLVAVSLRFVASLIW